MMLYADYTFYSGSYCGTLILENDWPALARQACAYIDSITYGRLKQGAEVTDDVRMAVCAVADEICKYGTAATEHGAGVKNENVDGYSVTYEDQAAAEKQYSANKLYAASLYLPRWDPLRYAGVGPC